MKAFVGLILSAFVLQALALPAAVEVNPNAPESPPKPRNEAVDAFREEINRQFVRYQSFYDQTNARMRTYRLDHVELVSTIYNGIMTSFGINIENVRMAAYELDDLVNARAEQIGVTDCLVDILERHEANSVDVSARIQECAVTANTTLSNLLTNTFYPTFAAVQAETSTIPISVIDILSRGNVLEDEDAIIQYMNDRYHAFELQWLNLVSQMLRWETSRFNAEGLFQGTEVQLCMGEATWNFLLTNSLLEGEVGQCN